MSKSRYEEGNNSTPSTDPEHVEGHARAVEFSHHVARAVVVHGDEVCGPKQRQRLPRNTERVKDPAHFLGELLLQICELRLVGGVVADVGGCEVSRRV